MISISRRKFIAAMVGAGMGGSTLAFNKANSVFSGSCTVRRARIGGPAGWTGRKIVFVTDIHYGYGFGEPEAGSLSRRVAEQRPDLVVLGGDLADSPTTDLAGFLAQWRPGCPTLFTPGNHDLEPGRTWGPVPAQAEAAGFAVLCNEAQVREGVTFIGLPSALRARQRVSLLEAPGLKLLVSHEPDPWDGYDCPDTLQLAGHTHGGQVRFAGRAIYLPTLGRKYPLGEFRGPCNKRLLVSAGIGCAELAVRINCPPEIVTLEFV